MMRRWLLPGVLIAAGCATTPFERHLAAGRWDDAARVFRADSSLHDKPDALYRAAIVFASPDRESFDPATARELFARLAEKHPGSKYTKSALHYIELLDEIERVRIAGLVRERQLQQEIRQLQAEVDRLKSDIAVLEAQIAAQTRDAESMAALVGRLEESLRRCEEQLNDARVELNNLKAIDLRNPQRSGTGTVDSSANR